MNRIYQHLAVGFALWYGFQPQHDHLALFSIVNCFLFLADRIDKHAILTSSAMRRTPWEQ